MIASLSIPWGETKGDDELGGYHLVWTRDLVQSATALLATGQRETPLRALIWLACIQNPTVRSHRIHGSTGAPIGPASNSTRSLLRCC